MEFRGACQSARIFSSVLLLLFLVVDLNSATLISAPGSRFHFITAQGRHLFKETTFTVSTLPRATLQLPRKQKPLPPGSSAVAFPAGVDCPSLQPTIKYDVCDERVKHKTSEGNIRRLLREKWPE